MIDKKTFKQSIATTLENANFVKRGQSWYLDGEDAIIVLNLQKNDWDEEYFINIGMWLKALGDADYPQENKCHLSYRAERLFPGEQELIRTGASLRNSNTKMLADLTEFLKIKVIPFLMECTHESKIRELLTMGKLKNGFVSKDAKAYLST
jgi:hypothetical protein